MLLAWAEWPGKTVTKTLWASDPDKNRDDYPLLYLMQCISTILRHASGWATIKMLYFDRDDRVLWAVDMLVASLILY